MSTRVMAAPVSLDVRMMLPSFSRLEGGGRPRIVPSPICLSRVKRCLFGSPSEDALQLAAAQLQAQTEADSLRWNFDFQREEPLNGQLDWQPAAAEPLGVDQTDDSLSPSARLRQSQITEFLQPRKRTSSGTLTAISNKRLRTSTPSSPSPARRT